MGTAIKPVALALRLFANMTAGHILVAVLLMFAVQGIGMLVQWTTGGIVLGGAIGAVSFIATIAIYFLEGGIQLFDVAALEANMSIQIATQFTFSMGIELDFEVVPSFTAWTLGFLVEW